MREFEASNIETGPSALALCSPKLHRRCSNCRKRRGRRGASWRSCADHGESESHWRWCFLFEKAVNFLYILWDIHGTFIIEMFLKRVLLQVFFRQKTCAGSWNSASGFALTTCLSVNQPQQNMGRWHSINWFSTILLATYSIAIAFILRLSRKWSLKWCN